MPVLSGFSDNEFRSRDDVLQATSALLRPLIPYKSPCGARIKLPTATGTGFDEISAQLEGYARPLWVVADLLDQSSKLSESDPGSVASRAALKDLGLESWVHGLATGVDPKHENFWGHLGNHDQRMVEMEPIAYALLSASSSFSLSSHELQNLKTWLSSINKRIMPPSNWRWFRVLVNLALIKFCGTPYEDVKPIMDADLEVLDSSFLGEGWSSDGVWSEDKKQVDYYSGSFAIQYSQLVYVRFAADIDPERVAKYRKQAQDFSATFWRYFHTDGAAIPFGRSLTYRFTFAAFFSAAVTAGVELPAPLNQLGVIKGLLLRHIRWWARRPDIFNTDGTFNIGYVYPNMYISEDYNSPQSPYWCLKTFSVLGLHANHDFWTCKELPHPLASMSIAQIQPMGQTELLDPIQIVKPAMHITCNSPEHHFLLSSGQFTKKTHKAREAKYGKFAYSSTFAFSVPIGSSLEQMAPDSTLSISNDNGDSWKVRWDPIDAHFDSLTITANQDLGVPDAPNSPETLPVLSSRWRPWRKSTVEIATILIPTSAKWPGWHVRIHRLTWSGDEELDCVDAGFAISKQSYRGEFIPEISSMAPDTLATTKGFLQESCSSLVISDAGASGVVDLGMVSREDAGLDTKGIVLRPDANTNLVAQRTLIPTIQHRLTGKTPTSSFGNATTLEVRFATGVFAIAASARLDQTEIVSMWNTRPSFTLIDGDGKSLGGIGESESAEIWQLGKLNAQS